MKRFIGGVAGLTLAIALGFAPQANAQGAAQAVDAANDALMKGTEALAAVTKKIGEVSEKVPVFFSQTKEATLDIKNIAQRLKDLPELMKAGMPVDQFVRVVGGNLADLENGFIKRLQDIINLSLVDFVGVFSDKPVQLAAQWNESLNQARRAMTTLSDVLASTRLPQGTQASIHSFMRVPAVDTNDLAATAKKPNAVARALMIPKAAQKLPVLLTTVSKTLRGVSVVTHNVNALNRNLPNLPEVQRVHEVGRLIGQLQTELLNDMSSVVSITVTDFGGIFSNDIALVGRKLTALLGNFNEMMNALALMLQSVKAPGQQQAAAHMMQQPMQQAPMQQQMSPYQNQQTSPYQTQQQWQQNQQGQPVPSPYDMVKQR
jgi:hypothetical protein